MVLGLYGWGVASDSVHDVSILGKRSANVEHSLPDGTDAGVARKQFCSVFGCSVPDKQPMKYREIPVVSFHKGRR